MAKYGIHECLHNVEDVTIQRASGNWYLYFTIWNREEEDSEIVNINIKYYPFCGENLEEE